MLNLLKLNNRGHSPSPKRRFLLYLLLIIISVLLLSFYLGLGVKSATSATTISPKPTTVIKYSGVYSSGGSANASGSSSVSSVVCAADTGFQPAASFTAPSGQTGLIQKTATPYFHAMRGSTAAQLLESSSKCPLVVNGDSEPYINAYTSYWMAWQYDYVQQADGQCKISNAQVLLNTKQALPAWQNYAAANQTLQAAWNNYLAAVINHENGHIELIKRSASDMLAYMQSLPEASCSTLDATVNETNNSLLAKLAQANIAYDDSTQHGRLQGAIVP